MGIYSGIARNVVQFVDMVHTFSDKFNQMNNLQSNTILNERFQLTKWP